MYEKLKTKDNIVLICGSIVLISAFLSVFFPFSTYSVSLAIFGVPHVIVELRYIDSHFHARISQLFESIMVTGLLIIATIRYLYLCGFFTVQFTSIIELCLVLFLAIGATYLIFKKNLKSAIVSSILTIAICIGIWFSPLTTLIIFAILHNLTPIGFIAKQFQAQPQQKKALLLCSCIFFILPLVVFLSRWTMVHQVQLGNYTSYLNAFVPSELQQKTIALPLFSAVTFLQCMHYAVVIGLFSGWTTWQADTLVPWPNPKYFLRTILAVSAFFSIGFTYSFLGTRAIYSIVAAIHAWVEIPLLLISLIPSDPVLKSDRK